MPFSSNFEALSDEILMIILQYSGNTYTVFRTFSGLNQRLNNILVDRRLHLLTDFLYMSAEDADVNYYYNSASFQDVVQQLSSLKATDNDEALRRCFQSLVASFVTEKYNRLDHQFQTNMERFQLKRLHLTDIDYITSLDEELQEAFYCVPIEICPECPYCSWEPNFYSKSIIIAMKRVEFLILTKGAHLECDDTDDCESSFAQTVNKWLLAKVTTTRCGDKIFVNPLIGMFKALIISNPILLKHKTYTNYNTESRYVHYCLLYVIYRLRYIHGDHVDPNRPINMHWYVAVLDLLLFALHCLNNLPDEKLWAKDSLLSISSMISFTEPLTDREIFIHASQKEILRIILDQYTLNDTTPCDDDDTFQQVFTNLLEKDQFDVIRFMYSENEHVRNLFHGPRSSRQIVDLMTGNQKRRQLFHALLDQKQSRACLTSTHLLFVLIQKKEYKLVRHLLKLTPSLAHQLDENGNDPLLYVCLKVRGCRHGLVEFLIEMHCDLQRTNSNAESFADALRFKRNRKLLERLIDRGTVLMDHASGDITVALTDGST